jgi:predicted lipoprotein with Yx(FWY)xxD motif
MKTAPMGLILAGLGLATALVLSLPASAEDYGPFKEMKTSAGEVLVDAKGMTLYTFVNDQARYSNCSGDCAKAWPPAMAMESDKPVGNLTIIKRDDGSLQWADEGKPLYTFAKDTKRAYVAGDNYKNVCQVVK